jgi:hypothetical protein
MWADIMTKPLQGTAFKIMRAELMKCPLEYKDLVGVMSKTIKKQPITAS